MYTEVRRAPHAEGLRAPPLARGSASSPCPEQEDAQRTEVPEVPGTDRGWMEDRRAPPAGMQEEGG